MFVEGPLQYTVRFLTVETPLPYEISAHEDVRIKSYDENKFSHENPLGKAENDPK